MYTYSHIQIHSIKNIMNSDFSAWGVGAYGVGAHDIGAHDVGAYDVGASNAGAHDVGAPGVGAHVVGAHNFGAHNKTLFVCFNLTSMTLSHLSYACVNLSAACNCEIIVIMYNFIMCTIAIINYYVYAYYFIHAVYYYY